MFFVLEFRNTCDCNMMIACVLEEKWENKKWMHEAPLSSSGAKFYMFCRRSSDSIKKKMGEKNARVPLWYRDVLPHVVFSDHPHSYTATTARLSLFCRVLKPQELSSVPTATQSFSRGWSELTQTGRLFFLCNGKTLAPFVLPCHYTLQSTVWNHSEILTSTQHIHYVNPRNFKVACRECGFLKNQWISLFSVYLQ